MRIKGSTVIIAMMYVTWIGYLVASFVVRTLTGSWFPSEVTLGTAALFIVETVSLARLKMAKEGTDVGDKPTNKFLEKLGVGAVEDFEPEVQQARHQKEAQDGRK